MDGVQHCTDRSNTGCISCYSTTMTTVTGALDPEERCPRGAVGLLRISPNNAHHYRLLHVTQLPITLAQICFPVLGPDNDTADTVRALQMLALCLTCARQLGFEELIYAKRLGFQTFVDLSAVLKSLHKLSLSFYY